jgi:hypothetical protein
MMGVKNALLYVVIVLTFALYALDYALEIQSIQTNYVLYVQKFVKPVLKNVLNMPLITKVAKLALKLVKNVRKLAHN